VKTSNDSLVVHLLVNLAIMNANISRDILVLAAGKKHLQNNFS